MNKSLSVLNIDEYGKHWKLENKIPVECGLFEWAEFVETNGRHIKKTQFPSVWISTVFLGIDHRLNFYLKEEEEPPILFESMIFGGQYNDYQSRYATYQEAEEGHEELCEMVEKGIQEKSANIMVWILVALMIWMIFD